MDGDTGGAPQVIAVTMDPKDAQALDVLRALWDDEYAIDYDDSADSARRWQAERKGVAHRIITAPSAELLGKAIASDCEAAR